MPDTQIETEITTTAGTKSLQESLNPNREDFADNSEALSRLQQAAHILVNGAIRAAQKQKAAREEPAQKTSKSAPSLMSGNQTFTDNSNKNVQDFHPKETCKKPHRDLTAEGKIVQTQ